MNENKHIKVSVIVPVYNASAYLEEMLRSLMGQTLEEIEMICVDDGSTDCSMEVLERLRAEDPRIQIFHQENRGAGPARNFGFSKACGEYVVFLDADDFFELTMLEKIYRKGNANEADVVLFGACRYDNRTGKTENAPRYLWKKLIPELAVFSRKDMNGELFGLTTPAPWTKAFRRQFIIDEKLSFQELPNSNDVFFVLVAMAAAERISVVNQSLVHYRCNREDSLQGQKYKNPLCFLTAYEAAYDELQRRGLYPDVEHGFCNMVLSGCVYNLNTVRNEKARWEMIRALCSERFTRMGLLDFPEEYYDMPEYRNRIKGLPYGLKVKEKQAKAPESGEMILECAGKPSFRPLVSVIIAVYNMERYLEECLDSIVGQSLKEIEVICIDDGSKDSSGEILRSYAEKDERFAVYSQENHGLSVTRNRGLEKASGKYVYFMDSDDFLEERALECLYKKAEDQTSDVIYFNGLSYYESEELKETHPEFVDYYMRSGRYPAVCPGTEMLVRMIELGEYRANVGIQFFRREFLTEHGLRFHPGILHEDNGFTFCAMLSAKRAGFDSGTYFHRRVRGESIMTKKVSFENAYGYFCSFMDMLNFLDQHEEFSEDVIEAAFKALRGVLNNAKWQYHELSPEEKYASMGLGGTEKIRFQLYVEEEENAHAGMRKAYQEKSEMGRKLQITYDEKFERGLEIKRLNKELNRVNNELGRIKRSRSYRLARIIGFPFRVLRKIKKAIHREKDNG